MSAVPLRVLIVEDRPADAELIAQRLEDDGIDIRWRRVDTRADFAAGLAEAPDIILSDWTLPGFSGLDALRLLQDSGLEIPFLIVSGSVGEEAAIDALRRGAADYVLKDRPARLGMAVAGALERARLLAAQRRADAQLRLAATVFQSGIQGVAITDAEATIVAVNPSFTRITGYRADEVIGRNPRLLQSGRQEVSFYRDMWAAIRETGMWRGEIWNRRKDGEIYPEWMTISAVRDVEGRVTNYVGVFTDSGDTKRAQQDADFLAHHDALTGLPNRVLLADRLAQLLRASQSTDRWTAVLHSGLDRFADANRAHAFLAGDELLREVAQRITATIAAGDTAARVGGDEFVVALDAGPRAVRVPGLASRLRAALADPYRVGDEAYELTGTVGVALAPGGRVRHGDVARVRGGRAPPGAGRLVRDRLPRSRP